MKLQRQIILLLTLSLLLSSCGYKLANSGSASRRVAVPLFVNETFEPLVEKDVTAALQEELLMDGRWALTDRDGAELLVTGRVVGFELVPLTYDPRERILEYRIKMTTEIKVSETGTEKVLWKENLQTQADYRVTEDVTKSKIRHNEAIRKASKNLADDFIIKVLDTI